MKFFSIILNASFSGYLKNPVGEPTLLQQIVNGAHLVIQTLPIVLLLMMVMYLLKFFSTGSEKREYFRNKAVYYLILAVVAGVYAVVMEYPIHFYGNGITTQVVATVLFPVVVFFIKLRFAKEI